MQSSNLFFASNPGVPSFWDRKFSKMPAQIQHALNEDMDEPVTLLKIGQILSRTVARGYKTLNQYLFYFGENGNLKGFTYLRNVYLKIICRQPTQELQYEKQIILRKDQRQLILYFNESAEMKIFLSRLETMCILDSFESNFRLLKLIGEGSSAQVYSAECIKDQQVYAVKSIDKTSNKAKYLEYRVNALMEEIQIMRSLNHTNLMGLLYVYETDTHVQLVMEYYTGGTLLDKLSEMNLNNKMKFSQELLETVFYMHSQGIMHRDLKPQNIIYKNKDQKDFQFVIGDFGFATRTKQNNHVLYKCGTPGYVAPEILEYKDKQRMYNAQCDVYSLGVIMYQIFFKCQPFNSKFNDTIINSISCTFDDTVDVPNTLKILLISMLRKDPRDRFSIKQCLEHDFFKENIQNDFQDEQSQSIKIVNSLANLNREKRCVTVPKRKHSFEKGKKSQVLSEEQEITQEPQIQYQRRKVQTVYGGLSKQRPSVGSTNDSKLYKVSLFQELKKKNHTNIDSHLNDLFFEEKHQIPINFGVIRLGKKS